MKTIEEKIAVMQHYANGGTISFEWFENGTKGYLDQDSMKPDWNWEEWDYDIFPKKQGEQVIIEEWIVRHKTGHHTVVLKGCKDYFDSVVSFRYIKLKLLSSTSFNI